MRFLRSSALIAALIVIGLAKAAPAADNSATSKPVANNHKTFTIAPGPQWEVRSFPVDLKDKREADVLILSNRPIVADNDAPEVSFYTALSKANLFQFVDAYVADIRKTSEDPNQSIQIDEYALDGVAARTVVSQIRAKSDTVKTFAVICSREGRIYICKFTCDETRFDQLLPTGKELISSFRWTDSK